MHHLSAKEFVDSIRNKDPYDSVLSRETTEYPESLLALIKDAATAEAFVWVAKNNPQAFYRRYLQSDFDLIVAAGLIRKEFKAANQQG